LEKLNLNVVLEMKAFVRSNFIWDQIYKMKISPLLHEVKGETL
jgi:hypothetical protein